MVAAAAHHPLAIQLVGMALAIRPHTRLSVAHQRMGEVRESGAAGADEFDQALNLSYAMLARGEQEALTRLGFLDQRRFAAWELAALADIDETEAWKICDRLSDAGLVARQSSDVTGVQSFALLEHVERYARLRCAALPAGLSLGARERLAGARVQRQLRESQVSGVFERVQAIVEQGMISRAFKEARDAVALARELQDDYGEAEATAMLAELHGELGGGRDVRDLLNFPLASDDPMPRVRALRIGAKLHRRLRQVGQARQKLAEATMLNASQGDGVEAVRLLREAAIVESVGPTPKAGLRHVHEAMQRLGTLPASAALCAGLAYAHGRILLASGEPRQAFDVLTAGAQSAGDHQVLWRAWLDYELAKAAFNVGEQQQALSVALSALDEFNGLRHRYGAAHCRQFVGLMLYQQGRFETAIRFLGEAMETFHNCGDGWIEAEAADQLALAHERTGQTGRARDLRQAAKRIRLAINAPQASLAIRRQVRQTLWFQEAGLP
jgi:tetratricopeptide (TPR) repeat protein